MSCVLKQALCKTESTIFTKKSIQRKLALQWITAFGTRLFRHGEQCFEIIIKIIQNTNTHILCTKDKSRKIRNVRNRR